MGSNTVSTRDLLLAAQGRMKELERRATAAERDLAKERALLDLLDREANDEPIVLHGLERPKLHGFRGLGLKCTGRTLRDALKQWVAAGIGAEIAKEKPLGYPPG